MSIVALHLTIEPGRGRPVSLARITDPMILQAAAVAAIGTARARAVEAQTRDTFLGEIYADEAVHLRDHLKCLIPGLS